MIITFTMMMITIATRNQRDFTFQLDTYTLVLCIVSSDDIFGGIYWQGFFDH